MRSAATPLFAVCLLAVGGGCCGGAAPVIAARDMSLSEFLVYQQLAAFIAAGGDVNRADRDGTTPLLRAVDQQQHEVARLLLEHGADVNKIAAMMTPLVLAVAREDYDLVILLLNHHADATSADFSKVLAEQSKKIEEIREKFGKKMTLEMKWPWPDVPRRPPIAVAIDAGQAKIVRALLRHGGKIHGEDYSLPPLWIAVDGSRSDLVVVLLEAGEDFLQKCAWWHSFSEATLLHVAAFHGNLEIVQVLVEKGANINSKTKEGETPLDMALGRWKSPTGGPHDQDRPERKELSKEQQAVATYLRKKGARE